ncbi:MAG: hypothetical protein ACLQPD_20360, partial [Desulfomonilaceae bacterium]
NLVPDKGSRFREGGITGDQDAFIDKTRCAEDGLAPTTNASRHGQTDFAIEIFPNYLSWLCQTKNTPIWPQKGAECELKLSRVSLWPSFVVIAIKYAIEL